MRVFEGGTKLMRDPASPITSALCILLPDCLSVHESVSGARCAVPRAHSNSRKHGVANGQDRTYRRRCGCVSRDRTRSRRSMVAQQLAVELGAGQRQGGGPKAEKAEDLAEEEQGVPSCSRNPRRVARWSDVPSRLDAVGKAQLYAKLAAREQLHAGADR